MKKTVFKSISVILIVVMVVTCMPFTAAVSAEPGYGSNGKFLAPIEAPAAGSIPISNRAGLEAIKNNLSGTYHLTADIDLSGAAWEPIGDNSTSSDSSRFTGTFDGQGYLIRNLTITGSRTYNGLFGYASDATIKNVGLEGGNIKVRRSDGRVIYAGGIVGYYSYSSISNCYNTGDVSSSSSPYDFSAAGSYAGGIVGSSPFASASYSSISNCYNTGNVSSSSSADSSYAGGIVGCSSSSSSITSSISNCYNTGDVSSSSYYPYAGGIVGSSLYSSSISNCYNTGNVSSSSSSSANSSYAGGIVGSYSYSSFTTTSSISNCYNTGNVSSSSSYYSCAGGIVGYSVYTTSSSTSSTYSISNCYNTGDVSSSYASYASYAGGIVGSSSYSYSSISNCYNTGDVSCSSSSSSYAGGIVGSRCTTISNCYWNIDSAQTINGTPLSNANKKGVGYGTGFTIPLTSAQMKNRASFVGFDFGIVWAIAANRNNGYPYLVGILTSEPSSPSAVTVTRDGKTYNLLQKRVSFEKDSDETASFSATFDWGSSTPGKVYITQGGSNKIELTSNGGQYTASNIAVGKVFKRGLGAYFIALDSRGYAVVHNLLNLHVTEKTVSGSAFG